MTAPKEVGKFSDLTGTPEGEKLYNALWQAFNEDASIIRLETATYLKRPAIEALQPIIEERFAEDLKRLRGLEDDNKLNRFKMAMGSMVRLILTNNDKDHGKYIIDQKGVRIRVGETFSTAARYKPNPKTNDLEISK